MGRYNLYSVRFRNQRDLLTQVSRHLDGLQLNCVFNLRYKKRHPPGKTKPQERFTSIMLVEAGVIYYCWESTYRGQSLFPREISMGVWSVSIYDTKSALSFAFPRSGCF